MNFPQPANLPIRSRVQSFDLTRERLASFKKALGCTTDQVPPTLGVITMGSLFEITRKLGISDERLLHLSQKFNYHKTLMIPGRIQFYSELTQWRERGKAAWATFQTKVMQEDEKEPSVETEFKILVNLKNEPH